MTKHPDKSKRGYITILVVGGMLMAAWVVMELRRNELPVPSAQVAVKSSASATPTEPESPIMGQETVEANMKLKWQAIEEEEADYRTALAEPTSSKVMPTPDFGEEPTPDPPETGISLAFSLPAGDSAIHQFGNAWKGYVNGAYTKVLAGAVWDYPQSHWASPPDQGIVQVWTPPRSIAPIIETYETPYRCGPLEVISEDSHRLLLASTSTLTWFEFDVESRTWTRYGVVDSTNGQPVYREAEPPCAKQGEIPPMPTVPLPVPTTPPPAKLP
jgi:hypothetical protein